MWPLEVFGTKEEAETSLQEHRKRYADRENIQFDIYPSEMEPDRVIPWFENYWGGRPDL
jgi:hypothetical protein